MASGPLTRSSWRRNARLAGLRLQPRSSDATSRCAVRLRSISIISKGVASSPIPSLGGRDWSDGGLHARPLLSKKVDPRKDAANRILPGGQHNQLQGSCTPADVYSPSASQLSEFLQKIGTGQVTRHNLEAFLSEASSRNRNAQPHRPRIGYENPAWMYAENAAEAYRTGNER